MMRTLFICLLLSGCANVEGKVNWCLGACVQVEGKKGEAPVKEVIDGVLNREQQDIIR